ncbi:MAG: hypothetical protein ACFCVH_00415 [Alphaproteobacteria bacterium]
MAKRDFWRNTVATSALLMGLLAVAPPALADFEDGVAAYEAGDYATALEQWRPLAEAGDPEAQYRVGQLFERGEGVPASLARAAMWYRLAANQDNTGAQGALDGVLETLRARETGQGPAQVADASPSDTTPSGTTPSGTTPSVASGATPPEYEPDRDPAYAAPGQAPVRTADVDRPAGLPARDGEALLRADSPPPLPDAAEDAAAAADAAEAALLADRPGLGEEDATGVGADGPDTPAADAAVDVAVVDAVEAGQGEAVESEAELANEAPVDQDALAADAALAEALPDVDPALVDDADVVAEAPTDALVDEGDTIGDLAALDEDLVTAQEPLADYAADYAADAVADGLAVDEDLIGDLPLPPELAAAMADGSLDADEIAALVEDGVLTEDLVDGLVESGMLDEAALADLAAAGVLDEAALDALVDAGLVDESLVADARALLADGGEVVAGGRDGSVVDVIGDGVARLFGSDEAAAEPQRRLITARQ